MVSTYLKADKIHISLRFYNNSGELSVAFTLRLRVSCWKQKPGAC